MAAAALIDSGIVLKLLGVKMEALGTAAGVDVFQIGDAHRSSGKWARLVNVRLGKVRRMRKADEVDIAPLNFVVQGVIEAQASSYAIGTLATYIRNTFMDIQSNDPSDVSVTHQLNVTGCDEEIAAEQDDQRVLVYATCSFEGDVKRLSGVTVTNFLT